MKACFHPFLSKGENMSLIDSIIIIAYLALMLFIGYYVGKDNKDKDDYFLAGRSMPWIPIALSVAATMISANGFIGGPGWAYSDGMFPVMVNITTPLAIFFAISVTAPVIYHLKITSIYEYMEKRFGSLSRVLTVLQFFINSLIQVSSMVFIPALIIQTVTGWSLNVIVPVIVILALIYTLIGGIKAVIWTDAIQMVVVVGGVFLILINAFQGTGLSIFDTLATVKEAGKLDTMNFALDFHAPNMFWATLIGGGVMWLRYFCFDQVQVQRVLTADSMKGLKRSLVGSAILMNVVYYFMLFVGVILFVFYGGREFENSNSIMITFILEELPVGLIGLIIAGVFAAAMSSVDSLINSMTTVFTKDLYEKYFNKENQEVTLKMSMAISTVIGILIIFVVLIGFSGTVSSILNTVGSYISYFSGPAAGVFILAMFTTKTNDKGASAGFIGGFAFVLFISKTFGVNWLWNPAIGCFGALIIGYLVSLLTGGETDPEKQKYTAMNIRRTMLAEKVEMEDGVSLVPFAVDRYAKLALGFFVLQYVILAIIQYS